MENKEFAFQGKTINGILMLVINLLVFLTGIGMFVLACLSEETWQACVCGISSAVLLILSIICVCGFILVEPGQARVLLFFGKYRGTFTQPGYYWLNPFISQKKLSLRVRNLDAEPIKVNDKTGNPIMIGMVLVWKLKDTYKAIFEIDTQTMAEGSVGQAGVGASAAQVMNMLGRFVQIQADAALRQVAGQYAYDDDEDDNSSKKTLRDGSDEINKELEARIDERLAMAGIEVVEARINYLAYAPEIAAVMLRRQQASAIISAREKIVEGAVSMVKMALQKLSDEEVVELDDDKKAAMVSNLLVVLCGDDTAQPVVNTGTLNH
ncbi:SPFH domain-containing protein [Prevotella copri]|jgi:regulator of protease activity HflC (stomatin/prohibitin superfamily)|uniref:SPFH domain-containing protein n=2 Tax=Prevotellaceae TaxID=171552 RepID=A0A6A7W842_9BACT|nr:SPFH domain-containing protein [Segatella copri]MQP10572.1 SPFH domain-containing protein [Segatella copri]